MTFRIGNDLGGTVTLSGSHLVYIAGYGDDSISGGASAIYALGWPGNDTLVGGGQSDTLSGGTGRDLLIGNGGDDLLVGAGQFDGTYGGNETARDVLKAGAGNDVVVAGINDFAYGGAGNDLLYVFRYFDFQDPQTVTLDYRQIDGAAMAATGFGSQAASGFERLQLVMYGVGSGSSVHATGGDDAIILASYQDIPGQPSAMVAYGEAGADFLAVYGADGDKIYGGAGDDILMAPVGNDQLFGGAGADIFVAEAVTTPGYGTNRIADFNPGQDLVLVDLTTLDTLPVMNSVYLVANADPVASKPGQAQFLYDTDTGWLSLDTNGSSAGGVVQIARLMGAPTITEANIGLTGDLGMLYPMAGFGLGTGFGWPRADAVGTGLTTAGSSGADVMTGTARNDRLFAQEGNDVMRGEGGDDMLQGYDGNDTIYGGAGMDTLVGWKGADLLRGGAGDDLIDTSHDGASLLNLENDRAYGEDGNDVIMAWGGGRAYGGAGEDVLELSAFLTQTDVGSQLMNLNFSRIDEGTLRATGFFDLRAAEFEHLALTIEGLAAGSTVRGSAGDDQIYVASGGFLPGMPGVTVRGDAGNDRISSGMDADRLFGDAGDDILTGSYDDILYGGAGSDAFVFSYSPYVPKGAVMRVMDLDENDIVLLQLTGRIEMNTAQKLVAGNDPTATADGLGQFLYHIDTHLLQFDRNGSLDGGIINIARLVGSSDVPDASQLAVEPIDGVLGGFA